MNPAGHVAALSGWRHDLVVRLRAAAPEPEGIEETIKWGHLVYLHNGPVCLIGAEDARVLFGFGRGQRLRDIEPPLRPGGKYEMATLELREATACPPPQRPRRAKAAVELNRQFGGPTRAAGE